MTSNPYTPDEAELIGCYAASMEEHAGENYATAKADAERGIAKIRAEAWDEGYDARKHEAAQNPPMGFPGHKTPANPYRIEEDA